MESIVNYLFFFSSNILSFRVKGVYALPEGWAPNPTISFTIATPKPHVGVRH